MKVSVIVITYNQEDYIEETIRSIVGQKTDFDFEIIVGEDASTDNTRQILLSLNKEFPNIKLLLHEENLGLIENFMSVYNTAEGEYINGIGGDDYWIDEYKLQKCADFLDKNPDYSLVATAYKVYYQKEDRFQSVTINESVDLKLETFYHKNQISAPTAMYRRKLIPKLDDTFREAPVEDWVLWLKFAQLGKVRKLNDVTTVYRIHEKSMWSSLNYEKQMLWDYKIREYIWEHYSDETKEEFFLKEKNKVKTILCSTDISKKKKNAFFNNIKRKGFKKFNFLIYILLKLDNRISRSVAWRVLK